MNGLSYPSDQANKLIVKIKFALPTLPKIEKRASEYILHNAARVGEMTLAELSASSKSSQTSIMRLCRRLGLDGYAELKSILKHYSDESDGDNVSNPQGIRPEDSMKSILKKVFCCNIQTLNDTLTLATEGYDEALQALMSAEHICFFAIGDAAVPCMLAQNKFMKLGIPCYVNTDPDMQIISASILGEKDVAIAISHTGKSKSVVEAMRIAAQRGATTIGITKMEKSPIIKHCDIVLFTATVDLSERKEIIAQRIAEQAIMEALYIGLVHKGPARYKMSLKSAAEALQVNKMPLDKSQNWRGEAALFYCVA